MGNLGSHQFVIPMQDIRQFSDFSVFGWNGTRFMVFLVFWLPDLVYLSWYDIKLTRLVWTGFGF